MLKRRKQCAGGGDTFTKEQFRRADRSCNPMPGFSSLPLERLSWQTEHACDSPSSLRSHWLLFLLHEFPVSSPYSFWLLLAALCAGHLRSSSGMSRRFLSFLCRAVVLTLSRLALTNPCFRFSSYCFVFFCALTLRH